MTLILEAEPGIRDSLDDGSIGVPAPRRSCRSDRARVAGRVLAEAAARSHAERRPIDISEV